MVRDLIWAASASECALRLNQLDLSRVAPFTVLILEPESVPMVGRVEWRGSDNAHVRGKEHAANLVVLVDSIGTRVVRSEELRKLAASAGRLDAPVLEAFHSSHLESPDAYSPACTELMRRR